MILYKLSLLLSEGIIFGLLAYGVYVAFQWLRFPDLTPDGSFVVGASSYAVLTLFSVNPLFALALSILFGVLVGCFTACLNSLVKIPAVVSGLLVSTAMYSVNWIILGKPNQFIEPKNTLVGDITGVSASLYFLIWILIICFTVCIFLKFFSNSIWGLKLRAIGENKLLAKDLGASNTLYTFGGLALANGIVALAGAMFAQKSFSADINMGVGITVIGLVGVVLGLLIWRNTRRIELILLGLVIGSIIYRAVIFLSLEIGLPAELFRLLSALILVTVFLITKSSGLKILKDIKWN